MSQQLGESYIAIFMKGTELPFLSYWNGWMGTSKQQFKRIGEDILVLRLERKQMCTCRSCISWHLHSLVCLSPCPNFTRDLVSSIKNKVLARRLATLPFLWLSCKRECISFKLPQIPGPSMDLFCSSQLWSSRGDAAQTLCHSCDHSKE